jgi:hypothetical protein
MRQVGSENEDPGWGLGVFRPPVEGGPLAHLAELLGPTTTLGAYGSIHVHSPGDTQYPLAVTILDASVVRHLPHTEIPDRVTAYDLYSAFPGLGHKKDITFGKSWTHYGGGVRVIGLVTDEPSTRGLLEESEGLLGVVCERSGIDTQRSRIMHAFNQRHVGTVALITLPGDSWQERRIKSAVGDALKELEEPVTIGPAELHFHDHRTGAVRRYGPPIT